MIDTRQLATDLRDVLWTSDALRILATHLIEHAADADSPARDVLLILAGDIRATVRHLEAAT